MIIYKNNVSSEIQLNTTKTKVSLLVHAKLLFRTSTLNNKPIKSPQTKKHRNFSFK